MYRAFREQALSWLPHLYYMSFLEAREGARGCGNSQFSKSQRKTFQGKRTLFSWQQRYHPQQLFAHSLPERRGWLSSTSSSQGMRTAKGGPHQPHTRRSGHWATVVEQQVVQQGCASPGLCKETVPQSKTNSLVTFFRSCLLALCLQSRTKVWEATHQSRSWHQ